MGSSAIGEMNIVLSADAASFSSQIDQAQRKLDQLAGRSRTTGRAMVSDLQATSGGLRLLEGGMTNSLRAAERFLSTLPGVGEAMKAAFPVVGAIAFGAILERLGKEVYDFIDKTNKIPAALKQGFDELGLSSRMANDELEKTDIELKNHIARLEGKPQNQLAEALIDARIAADKLAESLQKDNSAVRSLLERLKMTTLGGLVTGKEGTGKLYGTIQSYNDQIEDLGNQRSIALAQVDAKGNTTPAGQALAADLLKQIQEKRASALAAMDSATAAAKAELAIVQARGAGAISIQRNGDMSLALNPNSLLYAAHGEQAELLSEQNREKIEGNVATDEARDKQLQAAKDFAEEQKRIGAQQVQQWKQQLDEEKSVQAMTLQQEAEFWIQRAELVQKYMPGAAGRLSSAGAVDEANRAIAQLTQQHMKAEQELDALSGGPVAASDTPASAEERDKASAYLRNIGNEVDDSQLKDQGRGWAEALKAMNEYASAQGEAQRQIAETALAMAVSTGQISKLDAAQTEAQLHTQEFAEAWENLQTALANAEALPEGAERQKQLYTLQAQGAQMQGQRTVQVMQDQQAIDSQTVGGATKEALGEMVSAWQDMAQAIAGTLTKTVGGFNDDIANLLTQKHIYRGDIGRAFGGTFREASGSMIRTGLQGAESAVLGGFGFGGKRDGSTAQQALWVQMAAALPGSAAGAPGLPGSILGHIPGVGQTSPGSPVGNFFAHVFGGSRSVPAAASSSAAAITTDVLGRPTAAALPAIAGPLPGLTSSTGTTPGAGAPADISNITSLLPPGASSLPSNGNFSLLSGGLGDSDGMDGEASDSVGSDKGSVTVTKPQNNGLWGSLTSKLVSTALGGMIQGSFADGGDVIANRPAIVGEAGPELFMPASSGTIVPNHMLGGGDTHQYSIDARGSTDPAATEAAVHRAMRSYGPQFVSAAVARVKDINRRSPSMTR